LDLRGGSNWTVTKSAYEGPNRFYFDNQMKGNEMREAWQHTW